MQFLIHWHEIILDFHIFFICTTGAFVLWADEEALRWMLGKVSMIAKWKITLLHRVVGCGLIGVLVTGISLALPSLSFYLHDSTFLTKMVFVAALVVNTFFIEEISSRYVSRPFKVLDHAHECNC